MRLRSLLICALGIAVAGAGVYGAWPALVGHLSSLIEARLARETGLTWHIGGLALDPAPGLVLSDVTVEGAGVSGRLRRVRATGPLGLLLGGGGTVEAAVEDARLGLPLGPPGGRRAGADPGVGPGGTPADGLRLTALRAVLRGADATPDDGGRALAVAVNRADVSLDLAPGADRRDPAVRLELPDLGTLAEVEAAAPSAARPLRLTLAPAGAPRIAATASARLDGAALRLDGIAGTIDRAPFSGSLAAEGAPRGGRPRLTLDLRLDALALAGDEGGSPGSAPVRGDPADGLTVPVRADRVPDPAWFSGFDGRATVAIGRLALGPVRASAVGLSVAVKDGRLDASLDDAALYGGSARGRYGLEPDGRAGRHRIGLTLAGVRVLPLMRDVAGVSGLDGTGSARLDVEARGATPAALLRSAAGQAEVSAVDGRIDGLDLARAAGLTGIGGGLATRLDRLGGHFAVGDGRAATRGLELKTGLIEAEGAGDLDLVARTLDLQLKPLKVTAGGRFTVPIRISGPWDGPAVSADLAGLAQDPAGALQGLQNLGSSLLGGGRDDGRGGGGRNGGGLGGGRGGGLGGDLGGSLGGLLDGLMPRQDRAPRRRP